MKTVKGALGLALALILLGGCASNPTAVIVGKDKITAAEFAFHLYYNQLNLENQYGYSLTGSVDESILLQAKASALEEVVNAQIIVQQCKKLGLKPSREQTEYLKEQKKSFIADLGGKAKYLEYMKANALNDRTYDKMQLSGIYYELLYNHVQDMHADEEELALRQIFEQNFIAVRYIRFSNLDEKGEMLPPDEQESQYALATQVYAEVKESPERFLSLLKQYNDDPMMDIFPDGQVIDQEMAKGMNYLEKAFALKEGEISGVTVGSDGYYIVMRVAATPSHFEQHKEMIAQSVGDWRFSAQMSEWRNEIAVSTAPIYDKINFSNLFSYVK